MMRFETHSMAVGVAIVIIILTTLGVHVQACTNSTECSAQYVCRQNQCVPVCFDIPAVMTSVVCGGTGHGRCMGPNNCTCDANRYGPQCQCVRVGDGSGNTGTGSVGGVDACLNTTIELRCSGHGALRMDGLTCECQSGFFGERCTSQSNTIPCSGPNYVMSTDGRCICAMGYSGINCSQSAPPIITTPHCMKYRSELILPECASIVNYEFMNTALIGNNEVHYNETQYEALLNEKMQALAEKARQQIQHDMRTFETCATTSENCKRALLTFSCMSVYPSCRYIGNGTPVPVKLCKESCMSLFGLMPSNNGTAGSATSVAGSNNDPNDMVGRICQNLTSSNANESCFMINPNNNNNSNPIFCGPNSIIMHNGSCMCEEGYTGTNCSLYNPRPQCIQYKFDYLNTKCTSHARYLYLNTLFGSTATNRQQFEERIREGFSNLSRSVDMMFENAKQMSSDCKTDACHFEMLKFICAYIYPACLHTTNDTSTVVSARMCKGSCLQTLTPRLNETQYRPLCDPLSNSDCIMYPDPVPQNGCGLHGQLQQNGICQCQDQYFGNDCSIYIPRPQCIRYPTERLHPKCYPYVTYDYLNTMFLTNATSNPQSFDQNLMIAFSNMSLYVEHMSSKLLPLCEALEESCKRRLERFICLFVYPACKRTSATSSTTDQTLVPARMCKSSCMNTLLPFAKPDLLPLCNDLREDICIAIPQDNVNSYRCGGLLPTDEKVCNRNGICLAGFCNCSSGYSGALCDRYVCPNNCNGKGQCVGPNRCECTSGFSGSDCSQFALPQACVSIPSTAIPFCKNYGVNYNVLNLDFSVGAKNNSHAIQVFMDAVSEADRQAQTNYNEFVAAKNLCNSSVPSCDIAPLKKYFCLQQFKLCTNSNPRMSLCRSVCQQISASSNITLNCDLLPTEGCNFGSYLPTSVTCFGLRRDNPQVCFGKGQCIAQDQCQCFTGFGGDRCDKYICHSKLSNDPSVCSGNGTCLFSDYCQCRRGYTGRLCDIPTCNGLTDVMGGCSWRGKCETIDRCVCDSPSLEPSSFCSRCKKGYEGPNCEYPICFKVQSNYGSVCSGHGRCTSPNNCVCDNGYTGNACQSFTCYGTDARNSTVCGGHGRCVAPDTCVCEPRWNDGRNCTSCSPAFNGPQCENQFCSKAITCNNRGECINNECTCSGNFGGRFCEKCAPGFVGENCDILCTSALNCSSNGVCSRNGSCECYQRFTGAKCDTCSGAWSGSGCMFNLPSVLTFSANGDRLVGTYYSSIRKRIECKSLITDDSLDKIGGDDADCNLLSDGTFEIVLGAFATVTTGDVISFYQDPSKGDSSPTVDVPVASGSFIPAQPTAILFVEKNVVSSCDRVVLDASASATLDGRKLQYSWSASTAPSSDMLYFLNERFSQWKYSIMTFDASLLETGTYTVEVTVQSSFNTFSKQSISFDVIGNAVPTISLKEGLSPTVNIGSLALINAHIRFPLCYNGNPRLTRWNYTMDETKSSAANVDIKFRDGILVFGPSYTVLPIEGDYYFSVTAQADRAQPVSLQFKVTAVAKPLLVKFDIFDVTQSTDEVLSFNVLTLDPSATSDTSTLNISCFDLVNAVDCANLPSPIQTPFSSKLLEGKYKFTATYSKGVRSNSASLTVTVVNMARDAMIRVSIVAMSVGMSNQVADITAVDPSKDLVLLSRFIDRVSRPTYLWESDDLSLDDIECTLSYLKLPKTLLTGTFTIRLTVTDGTTRTGSTSLTFTMNQPPSKGVFEISPNSGVALKTLFNIGCSNGFSDPHLPLTYQFFYYDQWIGDWKQLNDRSERKSITSPLPVGSGSGNTLRIKAVVYDSKLASTSVETSVVVTAPSAEEARSILLNTTTQGTISQSTATAALDLLKTIQTNDSNIIRQMKDVGSQYINAYFENVEEQVAISGETSDSASAKIDVINTASGSSAYLHDSTSSTLISKLLNTTSLISSSGTINTESSTLDIAKQAADSLFTRVNQAGMTSRKANAFSKTDIDNLKQIYHSLLISYTKNLAPDMPATRLAAQGILGYNRKLNAATLNGLAEIVDGKHKYALSQNFSKIPEIALHSSVNIMMRIYNMSTALSEFPIHTLNITSKVIDFSVIPEQSMKIEIKRQPHSIANLTFESVKKSSNARALLQATDTMVCRVWNEATKTFEVSSDCTIIEKNVDTTVASVKSTGIFILTTENVSPSIITPTHSSRNTSVNGAVTCFMMPIITSLLISLVVLVLL